MVAFSDSFVGELQENQRLRYSEVMQALNMSAALTARKTKEFRSPPQEQVGGAEVMSNYEYYLLPIRGEQFQYLCLYSRTCAL